MNNMNERQIMTPERIKKLLPIFQAIAEGKEVQHRYINQPQYGWSDWDAVEESPRFDDGGFEWRIKPVPREFWILYVNAGRSGLVNCILCHETQAEALSNADRFKTAPPIHVREVIG